MMMQKKLARKREEKFIASICMGLVLGLVLIPDGEVSIKNIIPSMANRIYAGITPMSTVRKTCTKSNKQPKDEYMYEVYLKCILCR